MDVMRALFVCGVVAGPLFVLVFLIEGAMTPDYDPLRHPVSSLALGPFGWTQTLNFIFVGILTLAFAVGLVRLRGARHKVGGILVGLWGVGLIGAGAFVTDPVSGYPPGTPPTPVDTTTPGTLHDLFSVAAFFALGAACFVLAGGRGWRWAMYSVLSGTAFLGAFFVAGIGFSQTEPFVEVAGLWQRVCVLIGWRGSRCSRCAYYVRRGVVRPARFDCQFHNPLAVTCSRPSVFGAEAAHNRHAWGARDLAQ